MYKIIIVDDEPIVREGIRNRISWADHGFECVGVSENGQEALGMIAHFRPDVVMTDIYMPFMDGLELSRHVAEHYPGTKMIILTGYDDFEYAQQAVKLQVTDFILKPITSAELREVLDKLKVQMDEERGHLEHLNRLKQQLNESLPLLKERFLERMATMALNEWEIRSKMAYFQIPLSGPLFVTIATDMDEWPSEDQGTDNELYSFAVYNIIQEIMDKEPDSAVFRYKGNKVITILSGSGEEEIYTLAQERAEEIRASIKRYLSVTVSVGIGTICRELKDIRHSCRASVAALEYRLLIGSDQVVSISDLENRRSKPLYDGAESENSLISAIKTGSPEDVDRSIGRIISELQNASISIEQCYVRVLRTMLAVLQALLEIGCNETELFGKETRLLTELYSFRSLEEIEFWLKDMCGKAMIGVAETRRNISRNQISEAVQFIHHNYDDIELSVKMVSSRIFMSASYFSSLFKAHTGKTFVEYVTGYRMEKAKELLKHSSLKTYEIATKTGYQDAQYFSVLFKKCTGDTPTEYRQKMMVDGA
ncbi:response regulator [Paenibacillus sp. GCM10028914]|uniref:response regulator n=1 Tax=Paenibacillus sp. GCM10028914 TaxID=3273416 RepID=UPI00361BC54B